MDNETVNAPELFRLKNGQYIISEALSKKMFYIKQVRPEAHQPDNSGYSWDESGMAELFSECYENDTRFCPESKSWYTYDNGCWKKDVGSLLVAEKIKEFTRLMLLYCGEITDEEKRKEYFKFISKMGDRRFRDRLMKDATGVKPISATTFDSNPNLISGIFLGKNHFGYADKQEIVVEPKNPLGDAEDPEAVRQRYLAEAAETGDSSDD